MSMDMFASLEKDGLIDKVPTSLLKEAEEKEKKAKKLVKKTNKAMKAVDQIMEDIREVALTMEALEKAPKQPKPSSPKKVVKEVAKVYRTYEDFDYEDLLVYAGVDCITTSSVLAEIFPKICEEPPFYIADANGNKILTKAPAIIHSVQNIEMVAHEYIIDLEINGMKYYTDRNQEFSRRMVDQIAVLEDKVFTTTGKFNWNSGVEMQNLLYNKLGFTAPFTTKSGDPSTDGDALLTLAGIDPMSFKYVAPDPKLQWLADLAVMKDINSSHNTFIKTYVKDFVKRDGRIHPSYNLHGTSSFRITGSDPNLTQLPRPKHGYNLRECYGVDDGEVFICLDWSSAEVKILGALSRDPALLRAIEKGYDFHSFSASQMIGVPYEEFMAVLAEKGHPKQKEYKQTRQSAKALTLNNLRLQLVIVVEERT